MTINKKVLSLPPYISTSWKNISSIRVENVDGLQVLKISLRDGAIIDIPNLEAKALEDIFDAHAQFIENESTLPKKSKPLPQEFRNPFEMGGALGLQDMSNLNLALQHDPAQSGAPSLPQDMITKISSVITSMGMKDEVKNMPKAEPHCNCPYCQIARAIQGDPKPSIEEVIEEEEVSDEDLRFRDWDIEKTGENLYNVTNPFNNDEHYQVFLGSPVGCTCGQKNCEHIRSVLNS